MNDELSASSSDPIARLLDIAGDRWSFLIIRDVFYGVRRFDGLQKNLGISKKVLSQRLSQLIKGELLTRVPYQERPPRFEYRLTAKGRDFFPILSSMMRWSNRWLVADGEKTTELMHLECEQPLDVKLVCGHCQGVVTPARIKAVPTVKREQ